MNFEENNTNANIFFPVNCSTRAGIVETVFPSEERWSNTKDAIQEKSLMLATPATSDAALLPLCANTNADVTIQPRLGANISASNAEKAFTHETT